MKTGKIYKIITNQGTEIYVGSTFDELAQRFKGHKSSFKCWKSGKMKKGCSAFELFDKYGLDGCKMVLIKEYECVDRAHLETKELLWIKKLKAINKVEPFGYGIKMLNRQKDKNYRQYNKDYYKQYHKRYQEVNKEVLKQKKKEYIELNKDKIKQKNKEWRELNQDKIQQKAKEYRELNQDIIRVKKKIYRNKNKEVINERKKQKVLCDCGVMIIKDNLSRHLKTHKHINYINSTAVSN